MKSRVCILGVFAFTALATLSATSVWPQKVIDRIVARVQDDIILQSDLRELGEYQMLVEGKSESDQQLLERLIDQWIVRKEAETARFPEPSDAEVERSLQRLKKSFATPQDYEERRKQAGLTESEIRRMITSQLYLSGYLDSRFRPLIQVDQKAIEAFYKDCVLPRAKARGQAPPTLDAASDYIQEALIQQGINEQADRWLKESRDRLHVEEFLNEGPK
jgi:parvulin-like peptidyl-prolyl isomerase